MLVLPRAELEKIHRHATESWPEECCGFLVGKGPDPRSVLEARAAGNVHAPPREARYTIDPLAVLRLDRELRGGDLEHLGFYHSHPNYPPEPSAFDRERAWPGYSYLILTLTERAPTGMKSWRFDAGRKAFEEEPVSVP